MRVKLVNVCGCCVIGVLSNSVADGRLEWTQCGGAGGLGGVEALSRCWFNKEERKRPGHTLRTQAGIYSGVDKITGTESPAGGFELKWNFEPVVWKPGQKTPESTLRVSWKQEQRLSWVYGSIGSKRVNKDCTQGRCRVLITGEKIAVWSLFCWRDWEVLCCCGGGQRCVIAESIIWNITSELLLVVEKFCSGLEDSEGHHQMCSPQF